MTELQRKSDVATRQSTPCGVSLRPRRGFVVDEGPGNDARVLGFEAIGPDAFAQAIAQLQAIGTGVTPGTDAEKAARSVADLAWCTAPWGTRVEVVHGLAEASPGMQGRGELLHRAGWSVLLPDLRAFGRSEGDRASFGAREAADLRGWIDAVAADRPGARVVVWGRSMGAVIALNAAIGMRRSADNGGLQRVVGVIAYAPYLDFHATMRGRLKVNGLPARPLSCPAMRALTAS